MYMGLLAHKSLYLLHDMCVHMRMHAWYVFIHVTGMRMLLYSVWLTAYTKPRAIYLGVYELTQQNKKALNFERRNLRFGTYHQAP